MNMDVEHRYCNDSDACLSVEHSLRFGGKTRIDGQSLAGSINYERGGFAGGRNTKEI